MSFSPCVLFPGVELLSASPSSLYASAISAVLFTNPVLFSVIDFVNINVNSLDSPAAIFSFAKLELYKPVFDWYQSLFNSELNLRSFGI